MALVEFEPKINLVKFSKFCTTEKVVVTRLIPTNLEKADLH